MKLAVLYVFGNLWSFAFTENTRSFQVEDLPRPAAYLCVEVVPNGLGHLVVWKDVVYKVLHFRDRASLRGANSGGRTRQSLLRLL